MSSRMETVLKICEILSEEEDITTTLKESAKGTGITGLATLAGALLLGRKGVLAGSLIGGIASYLITNEFKSAIQIYRSMPQSKKRELYRNVNKLLANVPIESVSEGLNFLASHGDVKSAVKCEIDTFIQSQMSNTMQY